MSIFKNRTCILHHFSFLNWLPTHYYFHPITCFLPLKTHFLTSTLPFLAMCFMDRRGTIYTITAYIYAFRIAFSTILPCVSHHFTLRLAPKRTAFCTKLHCILHQIALHFAPKRSAFSTILHHILLKTAENMVQMAVPLNKNSFCCIHGLTSFCTNNNLRENRFFATRWMVGGQKGTHSVKILTENKTKQVMPCTREKETETESAYVYNRQRKQLPHMQFTTNGGWIRQTKK